MLKDVESTRLRLLDRRSVEIWGPRSSDYKQDIDSTVDHRSDFNTYIQARCGWRLVSHRPRFRSRLNLGSQCSRTRSALIWHPGMNSLPIATMNHCLTWRALEQNGCIWVTDVFYSFVFEPIRIGRCMKKNENFIGNGFVLSCKKSNWEI